jgi:hypothetical protein
MGGADGATTSTSIRPTTKVGGDASVLEAGATAAVAAGSNGVILPRGL